MKQIAKGLGHWLNNYRQTERVPALGIRELDVLKILWRDGALSAQQVLARSTGSDISLSTIQSTLERLFRKKLADREKSGRAYRYHATISQRAMISDLMQEIAEQISDGEMAPMISGFMDFVGAEAPESLDSRQHSDIQQRLKDDSADCHE